MSQFDTAQIQPRFALFDLPSSRASQLVVFRLSIVVRDTPFGRDVTFLWNAIGKCLAAELNAIRSSAS